MFHIVLFQPEIPPNTGNIIRLAANTGTTLHLVKPLGFPLDDAKMRRAGLDYHEYATMRVHENWEDCCSELAGHRFFAATTKASCRYDTLAYQAGGYPALKQGIHACQAGALAAHHIKSVSGSVLGKFILHGIHSSHNA